MADVEEPQFTSLADRIAALNRQKNFSASDPVPSPKPKRPAPPPPPRPAVSSHPAKPTLPRRPPSESRATNSDAAYTTTKTAPGPPALPARKSFPQPGPSPAPSSPALPPRRPTLHPAPSQAEPRRNSSSSEVSYNSAISNGRTASSNTSFVSTDSRKLPPAFDAASLPPLPPTRRELETRKAQEEAAPANNGVAKAKYATSTGRQHDQPPRPSLPPRLPSRPAAKTPLAEPPPRPGASRRLPPPPEAYVKPSSFPRNGGTANGNAQTPPPLPMTDRDAREPAPAVPLSSRPSASQIEAVAVRAAANEEASCLLCRDFSAPDAVAKQYPRETVPRADPIGFLAHALCDPFPSLTDKARAIFTWCHYNVAYDAKSFCSGNIRGVTPEDVVFSGLAVCSGYARVYEAIATRAGMACVQISGHGKGFGHKPLKKGEPCPPRPKSNHAWNAVLIDGGKWKLLDSCWGAGVLGNDMVYKAAFNPRQFTVSNETFGLKHLPDDPQHFYREDGRVLTWEEYFTGGKDSGEPVMVYGAMAEEGYSKELVSPPERAIPVHGGQEVVRFQIARVCRHWTPQRNDGGKTPRLLLLHIHGLDGRNEDWVPLETDGFWSWIDVRSRDLGAPGQTVMLMTLDTLDKKDARGVTGEEFRRKIRKVSMSFGAALASWELA